MANAWASRAATENEQANAATPEMPSLVAAHHAVVYRYACRLCGCPIEAEDLTQQTFLIAHERLHQLRQPERAGSWLLAVVRSCFLKSIRRQRPVPAQEIDLEIEQVADQAQPVEHIDCEALHAALIQLPQEFRVVLLMFYFEDLSYEQIAEQLDLPIGTVMSRLSRAKGHLRKKLTPPPAEPRVPSSSAARRRALENARITKPTPVRAAP